MTHYFFDIFNGHEIVRDVEGQDLASLEEVRVQAFEDVRELVAIVVGRGELIDGSELQVRDESGAVVLAVPFRSVIEGPA